MRHLLLISFLLASPAMADESDQYVQSLATDYGITLTHPDAAQHTADPSAGRHIITYKGKDILEEKDSYVDFVAPLYELKNGEKVIVVSMSAGGNACAATYRLIILKDNAARATAPFGNCAEPEISATSEKIDFRFYDGYGRRAMETYQDGKMTERSDILPLGKDPNNNGSNFAYLANYTSRDDVEKILIDDTVAPLLDRVMGNDFPLLKKRLEVMGEPEVGDEFIVLQGGMPHAFTQEEGYLALSLTSHDVYAAILTTGEQKTIRAYTNVPQDKTTPPPSLQGWFNAYPEAKPVWTYKP